MVRIYLFVNLLSSFFKRRRIFAQLSYKFIENKLLMQAFRQLFSANALRSVALCQYWAILLIMVGNGWGCTGVGVWQVVGWWGCRWVQSEAYLLWCQTKWVLGRLIHLLPEGSSTPSTTS